MPSDDRTPGPVRDATLIERALGGDDRAFGALVERYEPLVVSVVWSEIRGGARAADADDLVQDVFALAWRRLDTLRDPERFRPWLLQITRRCVIDHARHVSRRPALDHDDDLALEGAADTDPGPEELAELRELSQRLTGALERLSRRDATAITLATQFGLGPVEIGEALGIAPNTAKVVLHRARVRLRAAAG